MAPGDGTVPSAAGLILEVGEFAAGLDAFDGVAVELHLSNPASREEWRRTSVVAPYVTGTVAGEYPKSPWKIALIVLGIIVLVVLFGAVSGR